MTSEPTFSYSIFVSYGTQRGLEGKLVIDLKGRGEAKDVQEMLEIARRKTVRDYVAAVKVLNDLEMREARSK